MGCVMRPPIKEVERFVVDEHIWGHRLYHEQFPPLAVLEFLGVLASNRSNPLRPPATGDMMYWPQRQIRLCSLLFNNPYIKTRAKEMSDEDKWKQWKNRFNEDCAKLENGDMGYLREVFNRFDDFAKAVELIRSSSFEARSNKRWTSKFVFPLLAPTPSTSTCAPVSLDWQLRSLCLLPAGSKGGKPATGHV